MSDLSTPVNAMVPASADPPPTALQVQGGAMTALLSDPERLNALPVDKLERLLAMNERIMATQAKAEFQAAFRDVQSQVKPVPKRGVIDFGKGKPAPYALVQDVVAMLHPLLIANGFSRSTSETDSPKGKDYTRMTLRLRHSGGHEESHHMDVPVASGKGGSMSVIQAMASTYSYCERHLLCKVFGVVTGEDNDGAEVKGQERITPNQVADLQALIDDLNEPAFIKFLRDGYQTERVEEIAQGDYPKIVRFVQLRLKKKQS